MEAGNLIPLQSKSSSYHLSLLIHLGVVAYFSPFQDCNYCPFKTFHINPLTMQCQLCGVLVSLGHFNDVIQSGDKIYAHIDAVHNNKKSSNHGMGHTILQRHIEYRNNNRKCDTPQLVVCTSDKVHSIKDVQVMGTSSKVKSPFDLTKVESKCRKTCEEGGCTVLDVTRKCSAEEFGNPFKKVFHMLESTRIISLFLSSQIHRCKCWT